MSHKNNSQQCGSSQCASCGVRSNVLFAGIGDALLQQLHHAITDIDVPAGGRIYRMGESGEAIYTVRSGLVKLTQYLPDGSERIVRLVGNFGNIGLESLLGQAYQHDAVAQQASQLCRIPVAVVHQLGRDDPRLYQDLMHRWQRALSEADSWLTELATGSARQRVARLLLRLVDADGQGVCELFSRRDIAAMLGITTETASRLIAELKREGALQESSGSFRVELALLRNIGAE